MTQFLIYWGVVLLTWVGVILCWARIATFNSLSRYAIYKMLPLVENEDTRAKIKRVIYDYRCGVYTWRQVLYSLFMFNAAFDMVWDLLQNSFMETPTANLVIRPLLIVVFIYLLVKTLSDKKNDPFAPELDEILLPKIL